MDQKPSAPPSYSVSVPSQPDYSQPSVEQPMYSQPVAQPMYSQPVSSMPPAGYAVPGGYVSSAGYAATVMPPTSFVSIPLQIVTAPMKPPAPLCLCMSVRNGISILCTLSSLFSILCGSILQDLNRTNIGNYGLIVFSIICSIWIIYSVRQSVILHIKISMGLLAAYTIAEVIYYSCWLDSKTGTYSMVVIPILIRIITAERMWALIKYILAKEQYKASLQK